MSKAKTVSYISPKGIAKYPKLDQPYSWNEAAGRNMPDPEGNYETQLIVAKKDAQPLIDLINQAIKESGLKPKHVPYKNEIDRDTEEETGNVEFRFKAYGKDRDGRPNKIRLFDAKGKPVPSDIYLTSGSTIRLLGWISVARLGARLNIREVQIINLIERQASGFDAVEGDFVYEGEDEDNNSETFETAEGIRNF